MYQLATKLKTQLKNRLSFLIESIVKKSLLTEPQLTATFEYFLSNLQETIDVKAFNEFCGVGVVVTPEQVKATVADVLNTHKDELLKSRYKFPLGNLMSN